MTVVYTKCIYETFVLFSISFMSELSKLLVCHAICTDRHAYGDLMDQLLTSSSKNTCFPQNHRFIFVQSKLSTRVLRNFS